MSTNDRMPWACRLPGPSNVLYVRADCAGGLVHRGCDPLIPPSNMATWLQCAACCRGYAPKGSKDSRCSRPPLNVAARNDHATIVRALLEAGAGVNGPWKGSTMRPPLCEAISHGCVESAAVLPQAKAHVGCFGFMDHLTCASAFGHVATTEPRVWWTRSRTNKGQRVCTTVTFHLQCTCVAFANGKGVFTPTVFGRVWCARPYIGGRTRSARRFIQKKTTTHPHSNKFCGDFKRIDGDQ
jgi:hypothetical protein